MVLKRSPDIVVSKHTNIQI